MLSRQVDYFSYFSKALEKQVTPAEFALLT